MWLKIEQFKGVFIFCLTNCIITIMHIRYNHSTCRSAPLWSIKTWVSFKTPIANFRKLGLLAAQTLSQIRRQEGIFFIRIFFSKIFFIRKIFFSQFSFLYTFHSGYTHVTKIPIEKVTRYTRYTCYNILKLQIIEFKNYVTCVTCVTCHFFIWVFL